MTKNEAKLQSVLITAWKKNKIGPSCSSIDAATLLPYSVEIQQFILDKKIVLIKTNEYLLFSNPKNWFTKPIPVKLKNYSHKTLDSMMKKMWYSLLDLRTSCIIAQAMEKETFDLPNELVEYELFKHHYQKTIIDLYSFSQTFIHSQERIQLFLLLEDRPDLVQKLINKNLNPKKEKLINFIGPNWTNKMKKQALKQSRESLIKARKELFYKHFRHKKFNKVNSNDFGKVVKKFNKKFQEMGNTRHFFAHVHENVFKVKKRKFKTSAKAISCCFDVWDMFNEIGSLLFGHGYAYGGVIPEDVVKKLGKIKNVNKDL